MMKMGVANTVAAAVDVIGYDEAFAGVKLYGGTLKALCRDQTYILNLKRHRVTNGLLFSSFSSS